MLLGLGFFSHWVDIRELEPYLEPERGTKYHGMAGSWHKGEVV